jgi:hypothetical protein
LRSSVSPFPTGAAGMRKAWASPTISSTVWVSSQGCTAAKNSASGAPPHEISCWRGANSGAPSMAQMSWKCWPVSALIPTHPSAHRTIPGIVEYRSSPIGKPRAMKVSWSSIGYGSVETMTSMAERSATAGPPPAAAARTVVRAAQAA